MTEHVDLFRPHLAPEAAQAAARVLTPDPETGRAFIGTGRLVDRFEAELATLLDADGRPVLAVNSCTSALTLAYHLCGVGPGAVVVAAPLTCAATIGPIVTLGGRVAWADVDPETGCVDPGSVAALLRRLHRDGEQASAVVAVDWAGRSCDYNALRVAAGRVPIIQDAAHSLLATHNGRYAARVGGDWLAFSFGPIKQLSSQHGGALVCPDDGPAAEQAHRLRWHGLDRRSSADFRCAQDIDRAGWNFSMTDVEAAVLLANLPHVRGLVHRHRQHALAYDKAFRDLPGLTVPEYDPGSSYWVYPLLTDDRDGCIRFLAERGIQASQVHRRCDTHPAFRDATHPATQKLPGLDRFAARQLNIPVGWFLSERDVAHVIAAVTAWSEHAAARSQGAA